MPVTNLTPTSASRKLLDILVRHGPMTVRQLTRALGVTATAVRQSISRLLTDGWIVRTQRRGPTGRPADVFAVSPRAARAYGTRPQDASKALVDAIMGELGLPAGRHVLRRAGRGLAARLRPRVGEGSPRERLRKLAECLSEDGDIAEAKPADGEIRLRVFNCPYGGRPDEHGEICEMERAAFSELVGQPLRLAVRHAERRPYCEFHLKEDAAPGGAGCGEECD